MKIIPTELKERLNQNVTSFCKAWKIINKTGKEICFTEHDEDIIINGKIFNAIGGNIGAIDMQSALNSDRAIIIGAFNVENLPQEEIEAGLWNGAIFEAIFVDWKMPQFYQIFWGGIIGDIKFNGFNYEFELIGHEAKLNQNIGRKFTRNCMAQLGDENCKISAQSNYKFTSNIIEFIGANIIKTAKIQGIDLNDFTNGKLIFKNNVLKNMHYEIDKIILNNDVFEIILKQNLIIKPQVNDQIDIIKYCDKSFSSCKEKFQNQLNFYGCPFMPGEGVIYAAAGS